MCLFYELVKTSFRQQLTYRTANLAGLATNFFFGLLRAAVLIALIGPAQEVARMTLQDAVTYTGLTQAVIAYQSIFGWWDMMLSVYNGDIGSDLLKPMPYFTYWLAKDLGRAAACFLVRGLTIMAAYAIVFDITYPKSLGKWLALGATLILSLLVSFAWRFLVNLAAFWSPDARGIGRLAFVSSWIFSGFWMPLDLLPDWFDHLCHMTPFPATVNTVVEIYLHPMSGIEVLQALGFQLAWFLILTTACQLLLHMGVRKLVIQGG
jgi:ABC-2 type transport system permease protein